jgi:D-alanyl-D-alanine carboxypeptidase
MGNTEIRWKPLVAGAGLTLLVFLYPLFAVAPLSLPTGNSRVEGAASISPLGLPNNPEPDAVQPTRIGTPDLTTIQAKSLLVFDSATGQTLAEKNPRQPVAIASLTKLMTGLVVYNHISSFRQTITVQPDDRFTVDPSLGLKTGDEVAVSDLFYSMLIGSANDAALALANHTEQTAGKNFVDLMNEQARDLGMEDTHFSNPLGFDSEANFSTASDLAKLIKKVRDYQAFNLSGKEQSYEFTSGSGFHYGVKATNKLTASYPDLYAIKTGFTNQAQGAMVTEVKGKRAAFTIIILDSPNRENDTLLLRSQILKNYSWGP